MKTLVLIPTYNERENIIPLVQAILGLPGAVDVLVIDDGSPDGTAAAIDEQFGRERRVQVLRRAKKLGLGTAYSAGFRHAIEQGYDAAITMDADFSHNPSHIPEIIRTSENADMVIGSRYVPGGATQNWSWIRILISRVANSMAHMVLSLQPSDCTSGFRLYQNRALQELDFETVMAEGYSYLVEILFRAAKRNLRVAETPIIFVERRAGKSKISRAEIFKAIQTIFRLRFNKSSNPNHVVIKV
jgi:dolichol-phosphate mannosyltransferase